MDGSILAFLKCMDGSVLALLKCMDGSVWTHLNGTYGSIYQGPSKHQEIGFTPVTKVPKLIVFFSDLIDAIKK